MSRVQIISIVGVIVALSAGAYFALFAVKPLPLARIMLRRGYEKRGWTEQRLAGRVRFFGVLGGSCVGCYPARHRKVRRIARTGRWARADS